MRAVIGLGILLLLPTGLSAADPLRARLGRDAPARIAERIEAGQRALIRMHGKSLESPHWVRRCFGVQALSDVRHVEAVDRLVQALDDEDRRVVAMILLELLVRADEMPAGSADALGRAVKRLMTDDASQRSLHLALLAAERLPVPPDAYRPIWKRAYAKLRINRAQDERVRALVNVVRARSDRGLVEELVKRTKGRSRSRRSKDTQFLERVFNGNPGRYGTWQQWWVQNQSVVRFEPPAVTVFANTVDAYRQARQNRKDPEHGTPEYFEQFEVYLGKLYASGLDVVFVFDSTASMQPFIDEVKDNIRVMARLLSSVTQQTRVGLLTYRDRGDVYVTLQTPLTDKSDLLDSWMKNIRARGGGDSPEAVLAALDTTVRSYAWQEKAKRIITVIGDAPPHNEDRPRLHALCEQAAKDGFVINTIALVPDTFRKTGKASGRLPTGTLNLQALATTLTFDAIARRGGGRAVVQSDTPRVIADMLKVAFGAEWQEEVDRFVEAYLLVAGSDRSLTRAQRLRAARARTRKRLGGAP